MTANQPWPVAWEVLVDEKAETVFIGKSKCGRRAGISLIAIAFVSLGFFVWEGLFDGFMAVFATIIPVSVFSLGIYQFKCARVRVMAGRVEIKEGRGPWVCHETGSFVLKTKHETNPKDIWHWSLEFRPVCDGEPVGLGYEDEDIDNFQDSLNRARFALSELASRTGFGASEENVRSDRPRQDSSCS